MPKVPLTKIVEVHWFDAAARGGWGHISEYLEHDIAPAVTAGYLLKEDKKSVTIVSTQSVDGDLNGAISIPASWIVKRKVLRK